MEFVFCKNFLGSWLGLTAPSQKLARQLRHAISYLDCSHAKRTLLASALSSGRDVWCWKNLLDKEVSRRRLDRDLLRRPDRGKAGFAAGGRGIFRDQRRGGVDGLAGQSDICGARVEISRGRNSTLGEVLTSLERESEKRWFWTPRAA